jgi:hypothetical protein
MERRSKFHIITKNCLDTVFNLDIAVIPTFFPTMFLLWQSEIFASKIKKVK